MSELKKWHVPQEIPTELIFRWAAQEAGPDDKWCAIDAGRESADCIACVPCRICALHYFLSLKDPAEG